MPMKWQNNPRSTSHPHSVFEVVATLRVHAVSGGNWLWVFPVWVLGMVPIGTNIWFLTQETWLVIPPLGCEGIGPVSVIINDASEPFLPMYPVVLADAPTPDVVVIITRASVVVSDILVVVATWYHISHTTSVRTQLLCNMWTARPNLTTVMLRDDREYLLLNDKINFIYSIISLLNVVYLIVNTVAVTSSLSILDITNVIMALSSMLISHFLVRIREAAERSTQALGSSRSLSFVDSQGGSVPHPWMSSVEFAADIANRSAEDSHADAFPDLDENDDNLDSECGEEA
ncbi:predicted protein [Postia placenta Mad-698-R]|nr:predicted protein [Postia placenta Mad-698-R]